MIIFNPRVLKIIFDCNQQTKDILSGHLIKSGGHQVLVSSHQIFLGYISVRHQVEIQSCSYKLNNKYFQFENKESKGCLTFAVAFVRDLDQFSL